VNSGQRIRANPGPADSVLPPVSSAARPGVLGVLMLDTRFPRPIGDIGHPESFGLPVRHAVVPGAWPRSVVASPAALRASGLPAAFRENAQRLEGEGAFAITTSCGFLVLLQRELQDAVGVPMVTSSLLELPGLLDREQQVGVLTISAELLGSQHLLAAGVSPARLADVIVQGVDPAGEFAGAILGNRNSMDLDQARADVVAAALALKARAPGLRTVVLECTNMPPHAQAVRDATGFRLRSLLDCPLLRQPPGALP
jgi:hypothetical protein